MRRDLWEVGGRVFVGIRLAKGQGEREAAATGVLELAVLPRGQGQVHAPFRTWSLHLGCPREGGNFGSPLRQFGERRSYEPAI